MGTTINPDDPRLTRSVDKEPTKMAEVYLVLSEEERSKGFVRPVRHTYIHTGIRPEYPLRDLDEDEKARYYRYGYIKYEEYPASHSLAGRYWTKEMLESGCGTATTMGQALAETYARKPDFYGSTWCCHCKRHIAVYEFRWEDGSVLGS